MRDPGFQTLKFGQIPKELQGLEELTESQLDEIVSEGKELGEREFQEVSILSSSKGRVRLLRASSNFSRANCSSKRNSLGSMPISWATVSGALVI